MSLRVILTTGGTGGHIFPALAVAEALRKQIPGVRILFVGSNYGPERDLAAKAGLEFVGLNVRGMIGRGMRALSAMLAMLFGIGQAWKLVRQRKPDIVVGFGGYAAFATVFGAWLHGRPTAIHEQNAIPGVANKALGKLVRKVYLAWPDVSHSFPAARCLLTGNPIREDIAGAVANRKDRLEAQNSANKQVQPHLLVMGGSQGARAINSFVISLLLKLNGAGVRIIHQAGQADLNRVREAYINFGLSREDAEDMVVPFIQDMAAAYAWADLAICRSGATTIAELAASGTPSVMIPFPHAARDHQTGNAKAMVAAGGGELVRENDLEKEETAGRIMALLNNPGRLKEMGLGALTLARPLAADTVANEIVLLATNKVR